MFHFCRGKSVIVCENVAEFMLEISALRKMPQMLFVLWAVKTYFRVLSMFLQAFTFAFCVRAVVFSTIHYSLQLCPSF